MSVLNMFFGLLFILMMGFIGAVVGYIAATGVLAIFKS